MQNYDVIYTYMHTDCSRFCKAEKLVSQFAKADLRSSLKLARLSREVCWCSALRTVGELLLPAGVQQTTVQAVRVARTNNAGENPARC